MNKPLGLAIVGLLCATGVAESQTKLPLEFGIKSSLSMQVGEKPQAIISNTRVRYALARTGNKIRLSFDLSEVKVTVDNQLAMDVVMTADEVHNRLAKVRQSVATAPVQLKQMLIDSYGVPLLEYSVDRNNKETGRKVLAGPGAAELVKNGQLENARFFHPGFPAGKASWVAPAKFSMGNGNFASGNLSYKVKGEKNGLTIVSVSGTMTGGGKQGPLTIKDAVYKLSGERGFNRKVHEWQTAKMQIGVEFKMFQPAQPAADATEAEKKELKEQLYATAKGKMDLTLKPISAEKK